MFLNNKYTIWYYNIIDNAKTRKLSREIYIEKHHIIPKSLGGDNSKENLVKLTAREHFLCHWMLTKMTAGDDKRKMNYAFWWCNNNGKHRFLSIAYESARKAHSQWMKENNPALGRDVSGKNNPMYGVDRSGEKNTFFGKHHTEETKQYLSEIRKGKPNYKLRGRPFSAEHRRKISENRKDHTVYSWHHNDYGHEYCTRHDLIKKYSKLNIRSTELSMVINGRYKHHRGWAMF